MHQLRTDFLQIFEANPFTSRYAKCTWRQRDNILYRLGAVTPTAQYLFKFRNSIDLRYGQHIMQSIVWWPKQFIGQSRGILLDRENVFLLSGECRTRQRQFQKII